MQWEQAKLLHEGHCFQNALTSRDFAFFSCVQLEGTCVDDCVPSRAHL